jgi:hypothetical protein
MLLSSKASEIATLLCEQNSVFAMLNVPCMLAEDGSNSPEAPDAKMHHAI